MSWCCSCSSCSRIMKFFLVPVNSAHWMRKSHEVLLEKIYWFSSYEPKTLAPSLDTHPLHSYNWGKTLSSLNTASTFINSVKTLPSLTTQPLHSRNGEDIQPRHSLASTFINQVKTLLSLNTQPLHSQNGEDVKPWYISAFIFVKLKKKTFPVLTFSLYILKLGKKSITTSTFRL